MSVLWRYFSKNYFKRCGIHGIPSGITHEQYANFEHRQKKTKPGEF